VAVGDVLSNLIMKCTIPFFPSFAIALPLCRFISDRSGSLNFDHSFSKAIANDGIPLLRRLELLKKQVEKRVEKNEKRLVDIEHRMRRVTLYIDISYHVAAMDSIIPNG
jgi:hypothetical protein